MATVLERLLHNLGRPRILADVARVRADAAAFDVDADEYLGWV